MKVTRLPISRWQDYKKFYIESVTDSPQAFLWSTEEIDLKKDIEWQDRIKNMFFAIADDGQLVGMAGFYCEEKKKLAHIANIVRVYVTLASWKPNQIISDLVKLFDLFYADVKVLGFITSP